MTDVTQILSRIQHGDAAAAEQLLPLVYDELRKLADAKLALEKPGQTLQATALVHEAYLRLAGGGQAQRWDNCGHFFSAAAEAMRRILIDRARQKKSIRAGGDARRVALSAVNPASDAQDLDVLALNEALDKLTAQSPRKAELVKLRYFAGLSVEQAASVLGIAKSTAIADWAYAKGWLAIELSSIETPAAEN